MCDKSVYVSGAFYSAQRFTAGLLMTKIVVLFVGNWGVTVKLVKCTHFNGVLAIFTNGNVLWPIAYVYGTAN